MSDAPKLNDVMLRMQYVGMARVLCETHNRLVNLAQMGRNGDHVDVDTIDEWCETMDMVASDFNATIPNISMERHGRRVNLFEKEDP